MFESLKELIKSGKKNVEEMPSTNYEESIAKEGFLEGIDMVLETIEEEEEFLKNELAFETLEKVLYFLKDELYVDDVEWLVNKVFNEEEENED